MTLQRKRLAVFASGGGSNLRNIWEHIRNGSLTNVDLTLVISNNSDSGAIRFAKENGISAQHLSLYRVSGDADALQQLTCDLLAEMKIDLLVLAGYLKKLPDAVVDLYANRILNVHPALLPSFGGPLMYGARVHEAVLSRGCRISGATVHIVTNDYDAGPIVLQECCPVRDDDTVETLSRRVRAIEYRLLPQAIQLLADGRIEVHERRVRILE
jgi:formyltetrahydrofolate-dependent phosphoribosylglycinamide formyltransferase